MIKPVDPQAYISVVWGGDPAIDQLASNLEKYHERSAKDAKAAREGLKFKDGNTPTEWLLGVTPSSEANAAEDMRGFSARAWHSFLHSVRGVKGGFDKVPTILRDGVEYVEPAWLAKTMVGTLRRCALDLGLIVYLWNNLSEDDGKNS
jgi:hypothetical protein